MALIKAIFALIFLLSFHSLYGADLMALHEYDSSLAWGHRVDQLIEDLLKEAIRFLKPVQGPVTSGFGLRRHPILGISRHHNGVDIACGVGSEVRAVLPGRVVSAGRAGGYGNLIGIRHDGEITESRYGHLSRILVSSGRKVRAGDLIGFSGMTGLATGPHLHFELFRQGLPVDPERFLKGRAGLSSSHYSHQ